MHIFYIIFNINIYILQYTLWWASEPEPIAGKLIDWCAFNKALDLEKVFKEESKIDEPSCEENK